MIRGPTERGAGRWGRNERRTVRDPRLVDLAVCLDDSQGVGDGVRHDRRAEANESQPSQPDQQRVLGWLLEGFGQEVVLHKGAVSSGSLPGGGSHE